MNKILLLEFTIPMIELLIHQKLPVNKMPQSAVEVIFNFGLLAGAEIEANNPTNL
jgi:hypothetical protein